MELPTDASAPGTAPIFGSSPMPRLVLGQIRQRSCSLVPCRAAPSATASFLSRRRGPTRAAVITTFRRPSFGESLNRFQRRRRLASERFDRGPAAPGSAWPAQTGPALRSATRKTLAAPPRAGPAAHCRAPMGPDRLTKPRHRPRPNVQPSVHSGPTRAAAERPRTGLGERDAVRNTGPAPAVDRVSNNSLELTRNLCDPAIVVGRPIDSWFGHTVIRSHG
jgi:hypothetical protein